MPNRFIASRFPADADREMEPHRRKYNAENHEDATAQADDAPAALPELLPARGDGLAVRAERPGKDRRCAALDRAAYSFSLPVATSHSRVLAGSNRRKVSGSYINGRPTR
jgi:hypothetical protein